jgi:gluconokinase
MAPTTALVVMGVSGAGKTTLALELVRWLGWDYAEGDDFHPTANVEKMRDGHPLDDNDRWPWLRALGAWIGEHEREERSAIVTCSALKRSYRDVLRDGHPSAFFVHVTGSAELLLSRVENRRGHYMPASLLDSQLETLEPLKPDEPGVSVPGDAPPDAVADRVLEILRRERQIAPRPLEESP